MNAECGDVMDGGFPDYTQYVCALPAGHRSAHESLDSYAIWTDAEHWGDAEIREGTKPKKKAETA